MPRAAQSKPYVNFAKGFITEATGLTFPDNSVQDIENCDIELKGSVRRRLGLNEERGGFTVGLWEGSTKRQQAITEHVWDNAGGDGGRRYVVFQIGNTLYFRNRENNPVSSPDVLGVGNTPFLDISGFAYTSAAISETKPLQSDVGLGRLFLTSEGHYPFYLEYDATANTFRAERVGKEVGGDSLRFEIRDFNGVDDNLANDTQPASLSAEHLYNLLNQGWTASQINAYSGTTGKFPSNAQQWILGKDSNDDFQPSLLAKQDFGNSRAPRGKFKINPLTGDKDAVATHGVGSIPSPINFANAKDEVSDTSWKAVCFFSGRVFFAGDTNKKRLNSVYFSKTILRLTDSGVFCQENDPTSEHFSDLLDTDGGVISIPEADAIQRLVPFSNGVLVFALNGVWFIRGSDAGFTANNIAVDKVSNTGIIAANSIIRADNLIMFFAENGIHAVVMEQNGMPNIQDTTQETIFTFYNSIPINARKVVRSTYDPISKRAYWLYYDDGSNSYELDMRLYNRLLVFDIRTGAYMKHKFEVDTLDGDVFALVGIFPALTPTIPVREDFLQVGTDAVLIGTESVVAPIESDEQLDTLLNNVKVVILSENTSSLRLCEFSDASFMDYRTMTTPFGLSLYDSFVLTKPETLGDLERFKAATYLHSFFKKTETKFVYDNDLQAFVTDRPSGCLVRAAWDWNVSELGNRWSEPQQAYRYRQSIVPTVDGQALDNGEGIVYTKLKVRGKGRAVAMLYESVEGKDFVLLGYSVAMTANGQ